MSVLRVPSSGSRYFTGFRSLLEQLSAAEHEHARDVEEQVVEGVEQGDTARMWAMLSPVFTTRSGFRSARLLSQASFLPCPGVRCMLVM